MQHLKRSVLVFEICIGNADGDAQLCDGGSVRRLEDDTRHGLENIMDPLDHDNVANDGTAIEQYFINNINICTIFLILHNEQYLPKIFCVLYTFYVNCTIGGKKCTNLYNTRLQDCTIFVYKTVQY